MKVEFLPETAQAPGLSQGRVIFMKYGPLPEMTTGLSGMVQIKGAERLLGLNGIMPILF
jgi:hypothetical protein